MRASDETIKINGPRRKAMDQVAARATQKVILQLYRDAERRCQRNPDMVLNMFQKLLRRTPRWSVDDIRINIDHVFISEARVLCSCTTRQAQRILHAKLVDGARAVYSKPDIVYNPVFGTPFAKEKLNRLQRHILSAISDPEEADESDFPKRSSSSSGGADKDTAENEGEVKEDANDPDEAKEEAKEDAKEEAEEEADGSGEEEVEGSDEEEVEGSDEEEVEGSDEEEVEGSDEEEVEGSDEEEVDGSDEEEVDGSDEEEVDGSDEEEVEGREGESDVESESESDDAGGNVGDGEGVKYIDIRSAPSPVKQTPRRMATSRAIKQQQQPQQPHTEHPDIIKALHRKSKNVKHLRKKV